MHIYLDMDDVLCDTAGAYVDLLEQEFGKKVAFGDIFSFNLQHSFGLDDEENKHLFAMGHKSAFTLGLKPMNGMADVLRRWHENGDRVTIVTGRHTDAYADSLAWLEEYRVVCDSFIMVDKYGWNDTDHDIAISLESLGNMTFDTGVEDSPKMVDYLENRMSLPVMLFDRPWNRSCPVGAASSRCVDWAEVADKVGRLKVALGNDFSRNRDN